jgi:ribose/xylose/arabinose/galactoside ABC-type transport system permease subunit
MPGSNEADAAVTRRRVPAAALASALQRHGTTVALAAVCVFGVVRYGSFATPENLVNVLRQNSMPGLVALGMTFVVLTGGIDLSVGALVAAAGVITAALSGFGALPAVVAGAGASALLGLANGVLVAKVRLPPFIVTLAMMTAVRGAVLAATGEASIRMVRSSAGLTWLGRGELAGIPVPIAIFVLSYAAGWITLGHTRTGRHVYAVGDSEEAARLLGLQVDRVLMLTYAVSGALAGLAGVLLAARLGAGQPTAGTGWELDAIAAVVVGGTLLTGGLGGPGATLVGILLLAVIFNLFNLEGTITPWWQWILRGAFLLVVVVMQRGARLGAQRV